MTTTYSPSCLEQRPFALGQHITLAIFVSSLMLVGCVPSLNDMRAPETVVSGTEFDVEVDLSFNSPNWPNLTETAAIAVQLPQSMTIQAIFGYANPSADPALAALYQAEPGHNVVVYPGAAGGIPPTTLGMRVSATSPGEYDIKVSLLGHCDDAAGWQIQEPAGVTDFAQITQPPHVQHVRVVDRSWPDRPAWSLSSRGLINTTGGSSFEWSAAMGDVDGDGQLELGCATDTGFAVVWQFDSASGSWQFNFGSPQVGVGAVAFGDFNADGLDDVVAGTRIFESTGTGFVEITPFVGGGQLSDAKVGRINQDGYDDIVWAGRFPDYLRCLLSNGDGTFTDSSAGLPQFSPTNGTGGGQLHLADLDGDGDLDIVWARYNGDVDVWLGDGQGGWSQLLNPGFLPSIGNGTLGDVDGGDLDGDGDYDLIVSQAGSSGGGLLLYRQQLGPGGSVSWVYDPGSGLPWSSVGGVPGRFVVVDLDQDGNLDVVGVSGTAYIWRGIGGGQFARAGEALESAPIGGIVPYLAVTAADADGDGWLDLGLCGWFGQAVLYQNPLSLHPSCAAGTVDLATLGTATDVLTINGTAGGLVRFAVAAPGEALTITVGAPLGTPQPTPYAIFGMVGTPTMLFDAYGTPWGELCFPPSIVMPSDPDLFLLANTFAPGTGLLPATAAPQSWTIPGGLPFPGTFTFQGVMASGPGPSNTIELTNAIGLDVR